MNERSADAGQRDQLAAWSDALLRQLGMSGVEVDIDEVLALAGAVAHDVVRPAAPLTAYLVGFAVGRAQGGTSAADAFATASAIARSLAATGDFAAAP
jgi:hypothetical protein